MPGEGTFRQQKGREAEDRACRFLAERGIKVLTRNYRGRRGELDIIGRDGNELCIVEVRSRDRDSAYVPEASLSPSKIKSISRTAKTFIRKHRLFHVPIRFDLLVVDFETDEIKFYPGGITVSPPA